MSSSHTGAEQPPMIERQGKGVVKKPSAPRQRPLKSQMAQSRLALIIGGGASNDGSAAAQKLAAEDVEPPRGDCPGCAKNITAIKSLRAELNKIKDELSRLGANQSLCAKNVLDSDSQVLLLKSQVRSTGEQTAKLMTELAKVSADLAMAVESGRFMDLSSVTLNLSPLPSTTNNNNNITGTTSPPHPSANRLLNDDDQQREANNSEQCHDDSVTTASLGSMDAEAS
jgi:hypothetical protein